MPAHILIVEDDRTTRMRLGAYLRTLGYRVTEVEDAETMQEVIDADPPELLLLDINLEGKDGLTITREQRAVSRVGIILLTARTDQVDRIVGLEMGADDYVTKPFDKRELAARIKGLLARIADMGGPPPAGEPIEINLIDILTRYPGQTLSRARLNKLIGRGDMRYGDRTIDVLVGRLRKKIETDPEAPEWILTRQGEGYCFAGSGAG
jgi:two-component system torCAD operon response regulator TorR